MAPTNMSERRFFGYLAEQFLDIFDPLHLFLLFTHHTQRTSTIAMVSTVCADKTQTLT